jgi:protein-S-isoprenylcysteine O-methyltransferase Ste14
MSEPTPRGPLYPPVYFVLAIGLIFLFDRLAPGARFIRSPATLVGVTPVLVGLGLLLSTAAALRRHHTAIKPFEEPSVLLTDGTFRISRNPIYLGMVMMLAGIALLLGTVTPFAIVIVFAWWIEKRFIMYEEAALLSRFGEEYRAYQASVRRWV